ncbi:hypothetical protein CRE_07151 [Caenorhabditis remanei]|uniref:DNA helicase Pif1-like 2B domain-containing protein n=1 Tax=Caenorhabditis remanei TaxID=31234 RepID=E3NS21_CAERE|nr:hypothetical protein CRE_07151 [Caenorhabditis remanei]
MALLPTNDEVKDFNDAVIKSLQFAVVRVESTETEEKTSKNIQNQENVILRPYQRSEFSYEKVISKEVQKDQSAVDKLKKISASEARSHGGLERVLMLAEGSRIMLKRNVDITSGLVNGARGVLKKIEMNREGAPVTLHILFDGETNLRAISKVTAVYDGRGKKKYSRTQFPVSICYAASIHKSQGLTLNNVADFPWILLFTRRTSRLSG